MEMIWVAIVLLMIEVVIFIGVVIHKKGSGVMQRQGIIVENDNPKEGGSPYKIVKTFPFNILGAVKEIKTIDQESCMVGLEISAAELENFEMGKVIHLIGENVVQQQVLPDYIEKGKDEPAMSVAKKLLMEMGGKIKSIGKKESPHVPVNHIGEEIVKPEKEGVKPATKPEQDKEEKDMKEAKEIQKQVELEEKKKSESEAPKIQSATKSYIEKMKALGKIRTFCTKCGNRNWGDPADPYVCDHCKKNGDGKDD